MGKEEELDETVSCRIKVGGKGNGYGKLGKRIIVSPKTRVDFNSPGYGIEYFEESVSLTFGIGKDHTAELVMSKRAFEAFSVGEAVHVTTVAEWEKKYVKKGKKNAQ